MQQSVQDFKTALTHQQVSDIQEVASNSEEKLEEKQDIISVKPKNQESELKQMMRSKSVTEFDLNYVGHKNSISFSEYTTANQV